jgi:hypothetical protein
MDLVLGFERRIDAHPLDPRPLDWIFLGFRILSR